MPTGQAEEALTWKLIRESQREERLLMIEILTGVLVVALSGIIAGGAMIMGNMIAPCIFMGGLSIIMLSSGAWKPLWWLVKPGPTSPWPEVRWSWCRGLYALAPLVLLSAILPQTNTIEFIRLVSQH